MTNPDTKHVVTRIAPSPTGMLHIGTARSALFNYLFAKQQGGTFAVRIEDTDRARSTPEYEENILEGLEWLGLSSDVLVKQSNNLDRHTEALDQLIAADKAYVSKEPAKDNPEKTVEVVRLRNPGATVAFDDLVRGEISFDTTELGDFVIARSRTDPLYHLAVVVDDHDMQVTHVIRGEDHISNTPRQILIQEALGFARPVYAHLPLILAADRSKMSKRKGAVSMTEYQAQGFLASALINYLALLGWNPGTDQEVFTLPELVKHFSFENVQKGGAVFDIEKLKWLNKEHRALLPESKQHALMTSLLEERPELQAVLLRCPAACTDVLERFSTSKDFLDAVGEGEFAFYEEAPMVEKERLTWRKDPAPERLTDRLTFVRAAFAAVEEKEFTYENLKEAIWEYAGEEGRGNVLWPVRVALSGKDRSPDPFLLGEALGKDETLRRLDAAIDA